MSDFPNGRPPGQNNLDATVERYVDPKNDPSATAQKDDHEWTKESGIVPNQQGPNQEALNESGKNLVEPSSAEPPPEEKPEPKNAPKK